MYVAETRQVRITATPSYLGERSDPAKNQYFWAYQIMIENIGEIAVQLLSRHWQITDSAGHTIEVKGEGVVGQTPTLQPGQSFEYTSGTPLGASSGIMVGTYRMRNEAGEEFDAAVPAFSLDGPQAPGRVN
jgi:ApaG protein